MARPTPRPVTILLSTRDGAAWLEDLLGSIVAQTHTDWRLVVRDDGSCDDTPDVLARWSAAESRIEVVEPSPPVGASASYMRLLAHAADEPDGYFAFCDQDDVWEPHKLAWQIELIGSIAAGSPVAVVGSDATIVDADLSVIHPSAVRRDRLVLAPGTGDLLVNNSVIGATMVGTTALARLAVRVAGAHTVPMHDWWCALLGSVHGRVRVDPVPTIRWRRHGSTVTGAEPHGLRERLARRRAYLASSSEMARIVLADERPPPTGADRTALEAMAALDTAALGLGSYRWLRRAGVRGATRTRDLLLLLACLDPSSRESMELRGGGDHPRRGSVRS